MKNKKNKPQGFSLLEMLVVIMIILLVLSLGINTYQTQRKYVAYNDSVLKVLSLIKTARTYAQTSRPVFDASKNEGQQNYVPKEGYGVYIERSEQPGNSRIVLFANTVTENDEAKNQYDEGDVIEEYYNLNTEVDFRGLWKNRDEEATPISDSTPNQAVILFRPPLADTTMAVNNHPLKGELNELEDLYLEFRQREAAEGIPSHYIHINSISGVAEMSR